MKRRIKVWFGGSDDSQVRLPNGVTIGYKDFTKTVYTMGLMGETGRQYWLGQGISRGQWEGIMQLLRAEGEIERIDGRGRVYLKQPVGPDWWDRVKDMAARHKQ